MTVLNAGQHNSLCAISRWVLAASLSLHNIIHPPQTTNIFIFGHPIYVCVCVCVCCFLFLFFDRLSGFGHFWSAVVAAWAAVSFGLLPFWFLWRAFCIFLSCFFLYIFTELIFDHTYVCWQSKIVFEIEKLQYKLSSGVSYRVAVIQNNATTQSSAQCPPCRQPFSPSSCVLLSAAAFFF